MSYLLGDLDNFHKLTSFTFHFLCHPAVTFPQLLHHYIAHPEGGEDSDAALSLKVTLRTYLPRCSFASCSLDLSYSWGDNIL